MPTLLTYFSPIVPGKPFLPNNRATVMIAGVAHESVNILSGPRIDVQSGVRVGSGQFPYGPTGNAV